MKVLSLIALLGAANAEEGIEALPVGGDCKDNYGACDVGLCCGAGINKGDMSEEGEIAHDYQ